MKLFKVNHYKDFDDQIQAIGFCLMGGNNEGIFTLDELYTKNIECHTGDVEHDPWIWRMRSITEKDDMSYGKVFLKKSGWISRAWLPYFVAVRRHGRTMRSLFLDGLMTQMDKKVYDLIESSQTISLAEILDTLGRENKTEINKSMVNLQMLLFITTYGETYKISKEGKPYGWPVMVFSTIEEKFGEAIEDEIFNIEYEDAYDKIKNHIKLLNPTADDKKIKRFIKAMK